MILYFSATGNCKYVAEKIAKATNDKAFSIENFVPEISLKKDEMLIIVSPTYFWALPPIMSDFISHLNTKIDESNYACFISTFGTTPGFSGEMAKKLLSKQGIFLNAQFSIKMPDTWTVIFDLSDKKKVTRKNEAAEIFIDKTIEKIKARKCGNHTSPKMPYFIHFFSDILLNNARKTKKFYVEESCVGCGLCTKKCPFNAIEIQEKKPVWVKEQCTLCLRCLHNCPKFAIQYGNGKTKKHGQYTHESFTEN